MKILLFCPMNPNIPRLWRRTIESILKVQWTDPIDYWITANDNPLEQDIDNISRQYNKARERVLEGGYDALLCVESDMIVPPDTLQRLLACESDVAYGLYVFRHTRHGLSAYTEIAGKSGHSISEDADRTREAWGKVIDVAGVGMGCTLIRRNVMKYIPFRLGAGDLEKADCDWTFAIDCHDYGYTQRCDLGVVCGHHSYKPYPMILWPDLDEPKFYRRETLPGVSMKPIRAGDTFAVGLGETMLAKAN